MFYYIYVTYFLINKFLIYFLNFIKFGINE